jgi:hypothetical protein
VNTGGSCIYMMIEYIYEEMTQIKKNGLVLQSIDYPLIRLCKVDRIVIATVSVSEFIAL